MMRCALYTVAFAAPLWAFVAVWWSLTAAVTIAIIGAAAWITAGCADWVRAR